MVWPERGAEISSVVICAEDIFCETAWLIDELIDADRGIDALSLTTGLWTNAIFDVARWGNQVSLTDRYLIVSMVFRIVATAFSLHWNSYYSDNLRDALLETEDKKRSEPESLYILKEQQRQQDALLEAIIPCSQLLRDWVNEYIDNPELWLTKEIELALNPPVTIKAGKQESRKGDKKSLIRKRTSWEGIDFTHSFAYVTKSMSAEEKNKRLSVFFNLLNKKYISHTEMATFINIFSGVETCDYIVWRGFIVELHYFIESLINKGLITWNRPAPGKWQIVCARFRIEHTAEEAQDNANRKNKSKVIDALKPSQFNKIPKANKLKEHAILDKIISILVEESDSAKINREVIEMFAKMEISEKEGQTSQSQVRKVEY